MRIGKVIGDVVATIKDPGLKSLRLLIVKDVDDNLKPIGKPYIAADGISAGPGDIIYLVSKKEAAIALSPKGLIPIDECIVGYVDDYNVQLKIRKKKEVTTKPVSKQPVTVRKTKPPVSKIVEKVKTAQNDIEESKKPPTIAVKKPVVKTKVPSQDKEPVIKTKVPSQDKEPVIKTKVPSQDKEQTTKSKKPKTTKKSLD